MARIWKSGADKIKVTVRHSDSQSHYAYTTARRTLCGRMLEKVNSRAGVLA
jgi:ssDNA-binding Zn-finger/Zn-ribbon topoisomerase 1